MDVAQAHQKRIAQQTLKYSLAGARIMGGMSYARAYRIVFGVNLRDRIEALQAEYPDPPAWFSWELGQYGYTPKDWPALAAEVE